MNDFCRHKLEPRDDLDDEAVEELQSRCNTALEVFQALFGDRAEFADPLSISTFLNGATDKGNQYLLDRLITWADALVSKYTKKDGTVFRKAYTVAELTNQVEPFTKTVNTLEGETPTPSPWPLVGVVK